MRPTALVPIIAMPIDGQEFFHWVDGKTSQRCIIMNVFGSSARVIMSNHAYPQFVDLIDLYTVV